MKAKKRTSAAGAGRCFDAVEVDGTKVRACLKTSSVELTARRDGRKVGHAFLDTHKGALVVGEIEVSECARRSRVGTRLYEAALVVGCRAGLPVTSDSMRSQYAEAFWRKQASKGRAVCEAGRGSVYEAPTGGIRRDMPIPGEDDAGDPAWDCARYVVSAPCGVSSLAGTKKPPTPKRRGR